MRLPAHTIGLALVIASCCTPLVHAQWYAPATEYHDPVQRVFVVEAARVLAWRENQTGAKIAQVTYDVATEEGGATRWNVRWLDAKGQIWRQATVRYSGERLLGGGEFYRDAVRQLSVQSWTAPVAVRGAAADHDFWAGLGDMGAARMATLRTALTRAAENQPPRLAGRLLAAAVPSVGGLVTLDSTLAARGAAWLALAEGTGDPSSKGEDRRWAVVLWLARREAQAAALWAHGSGAAPRSGKGATAAFAWWDFVLREPTARTACVRAAEYDDPAWAFPLLAVGARLKRSASLLSSSARIIFDYDEARVLPAHDCAAWVSATASVEGGHLTNGGWVAAARADWLETLRALPAAQRRLSADPVLQRAWAVRAVTAPETDPSVAGFGAAAELVRLGNREGVGPLEPVAIVTERDLLNFGWEITGTQLAARQLFLANRYGDRAAASKHRRLLLEAVPEIGPFLQTATWSTLLPSIDSYDRLQRIEGAVNALTRTPAEVFGSADPAERARRLAVRNWLMIDHMNRAAGALIETKQPDLVAPLVRRLHEEGGGMVDRELLYLLTATGGSLPDREALKLECATRLPEDDNLWRSLRRSETAGKTVLARAQAMERLYWRDPSDTDATLIFSNYVTASAWPAVKRFYDRIAPLIDDRVGFSNNIGPRRLMLALLENDFAMVDRVLAEMSTGSSRDLASQIVVAAARGEPARAAFIAQEALDRYPSTSSTAPMRVLLNFIPLWPALATPGHPRRDEALDHFARHNGWATFQWMLARRLKLGPEETIRFLGGDQEKTERGVMIHYLQGDRRGYSAAQVEFYANRNYRQEPMASLLLLWLRADLYKTRVPPDLPEFAAIEPVTTLMAVRRAHDAHLKARFDAELGKVSSADELWACGEKMRAAQTAGDGRWTLRALREYDETLRVFQERFARDPRAWTARLARVSLAPAMAVEGAKVIATTVRRELETIVASEAPRAVRAEAAFTLLQRDYDADVQESSNPVVRRAFAERTKEWQKEFSGEASEDNVHLLAAEALWGLEPDDVASALQRAAMSTQAEIARTGQIRRRAHELFMRPVEATLTAFDGSKLNLATLRGRAVLVQFWSAALPQSLENAAFLKALDHVYREGGLSIVGVALDDRRNDVVNFLRRNKSPWPQHLGGAAVGLNPNVEWGLATVPALWLIDKGGRMVSVRRSSDLEKEIIDLLAR